MKRCLFSAILLLTALTVHAQTAWHYHYSDGRAVIKKEGLYGFVDRDRNEVIPCRYDKAYTFNDGIAMIRHQGEVFAIDTLGNRLDCEVRIPKFFNGEFARFANEVERSIYFKSTDEYERLKNAAVNVVVTIGADGRITACEDDGSTDSEALAKVTELVLHSPRWTPAAVDGKPRAIRYLLPVDFSVLKYKPSRYFPIDNAGRRIDHDFTDPAFQQGSRYDFQRWFFKHLKFKDTNEYHRAASGAVKARFVIDAKGRISDIEILSSHNDICRRKTIELLKKSPRWTPATIDGKPVRTRYETTFHFRFRR